MKTVKISLLFIVSMLSFVSCFAQEVQAPVEMADGLRSSGKIYVVVTVLSVIFSGIIIYLISIDRKLSRLEKEMKKNLIK